MIGIEEKYRMRPTEDAYKVNPFRTYDQDTTVATQEQLYERAIDGKSAVHLEPEITPYDTGIRHVIPSYQLL